MSWSDRVAILLDGEYVKKVLQKKTGRFPQCADVMAEVDRILQHDAVKDFGLYRVFYYTADPLTGTVTHPLSGDPIDFGATATYSKNTQLISKVENQPNVAVRRGALAHQGWEIGSSALREFTRGSKTTLEQTDVVPKISQKGVDVRIGLDIASLALKRLVSVLVLVTGDADMVPAMKLARREGVRVFLDTVVTRSVRSELKIHADLVLS